MEWNTVERAIKTERDTRTEQKKSGQARLVYVRNVNRNIPTRWTWTRAGTRRAESRKRNGITDWRWDWTFHWIFAGISGRCEIHLIPVTKIKIKVGMPFCKSPKRLIGGSERNRFVLILRTEVSEDKFAKWAFANRRTNINPFIAEFSFVSLSSKIIY